MSTWVRKGLAVLAIGAALSIAAGAVGFLWLDARLPDVFSFAAYQRIAIESTRIHASGGELIGRFGEENRTVVPLSEIPRSLMFAAVCAEDASFFHHPGLDVFGIIRALWIDSVQGRFVQGASTITQQFAKTRYLSAEKTITRKLKELVLTRKLEQKLSKEDILSMYLNEIYFGHGRYGVEEAARYYLGKPVRQVDLAEAAMLAGVVNSPERLSPFRDAKACLARRAYVLDQMQRKGYISAPDAARAAEMPLPTVPHGDLVMQAPYYVSHVRRLLRKKVGAASLKRGGLRVEVAMDVVAQAAAQRAVDEGLGAIDTRHGYGKPLRRYATEAQLHLGVAKIAAAQLKTPVRDGQIRLGIVLGANEQGDTLRVALGDGEGDLPVGHLSRYQKAAKSGDQQPAPRTLQRGDLIRVAVLRRPPAPETRALLLFEGGPQAALVAIEPETRLVRALIGGDDFGLHPFNRALRANRQPGSTFKTFVYGAAFEAGQLTPDDQLPDSRRTWISGGRPWTPRNYSGKWDGENHTIRDALARSINSIAVAVADATGPQRVVDFARRAGITSPMRADLPLALGASSVTPIELTNAYATIAADGRSAAPIFITRIVQRDGRAVFTASPQLQQAISSKVSVQLADMLGEVMRSGSGRKARIGRPVAGKTGTTNRGRDAWFVGFSKQLCAAVWIGHDDRKPIPKGSGAKLALPIWADFMRAAHTRVAVVPLPRLPHVASRDPLPVQAVGGDPGSAASDDEDPEVSDVEDEVLKAYGERL